MNDDELGVRLLRPLAGEPSGPPRIDVPRAMAEGRKRRKLRWWSSGAAVLALTTAAAGGGTLAATAMDNGPAPRPTPSVTAASQALKAPAGPTDCTVTRLPTNGIAKAVLTAGDPSGHYLAGRLYPSTKGFDRPIVVWRDGTILATAAMPGSDQTLYDLNASGVGVGTSFDGNDKQHAYVYRNETFRRLAGGTAAAIAINDAGVIAGTLGDDNGVPARWSSATATPKRLSLPTGATTGEVVGIDEDGTIAGRAGPGDGEPTGYLWLPDDTRRTMPVPTVDGAKGSYFWPDAIRDGWVVGQAVLDGKDGSRTFESYRYRISTGRYERMPVSLSGGSYLAANGWVAGVAANGPVIVAGDKAVELPRHGTDVEYVMSSLSADGKVAGGYSVGNGNPVSNEPLMWRCR
jgi:hypothetical protein